MARIYKGVDFGKGVTCTFTEFNKGFAGQFVKHKYNQQDKKIAFEIASITVKATDVPAPKERKKANAKKGKK